MKLLIMKMNILVKESIGRLMRVSGNTHLMHKECDKCRYTDLIESEIDQVIDRMNIILNILEGRSNRDGTKSN